MLPDQMAIPIHVLSSLMSRKYAILIRLVNSQNYSVISHTKADSTALHLPNR